MIPKCDFVNVTVWQKLWSEVTVKILDWKWLENGLIYWVDEDWLKNKNVLLHFLRNKPLRISHVVI